MRNRIQLLFLTLAFSLSSFAQTVNPWAESNERELSSLDNVKAIPFPAASTFYRLNLQNMTTVLLSASDNLVSDSNVIIQIPNIDGKMESFKIWESSNFAPELQAAYPSIRAYTGIGVTDPSAYLKISLAPNGIQTMVVRADKGAEFIEPYTSDGLYYALFNSRERNPNDPAPFSCSTKVIQRAISTENSPMAVLSNAKTFRTFRLALSCTGEYTAFFGGTVSGALAGMNATLTRVNGLYEKELSVRFVLIANNTSLIYTNATTDPYSNASTGANGTWNQELQTNLTSTIGNANYDMGHLFGASGGGGNAGCIGCVCTDPTGGTPLAKGAAFTSPANSIPQGDSFDIDFVVHEMGHQLGASHSFTYSSEGTTGVQIEPGGGSTIMAYAGVTSYNIQMHSDAYFTYGSLNEIQKYLASTSCGTITALANTPPVINAGADYTIPINTPFVLTGTGTDADGDTIAYNWEQYDSLEQYNAGTASKPSYLVNSQSFTYATKPGCVNFRSVMPTGSPSRYFPKLETILSSTGSIPTVTQSEALSSVNRAAMNFVLTGRDNRAGGGQTNSDFMQIHVDGTKGPLTVTSQNTDNGYWDPGSTQTITWAVNSTNTIAGGENVDIILFSADSGGIYPVVALAGTPNNGSATITVPYILVPNCRVMVKASNNVFFAVNSKPFNIGYGTTTTCVTPGVSTAVAIPSGGTTYSSSSVNVSNTGTVQSIDVKINATHPNYGELTFVLMSPNNTSVILTADYCQGSSLSSANTLTFIDSGNMINCGNTPIKAANILPQDPLYNFIGQQAAGTWTLKYLDDTVANSGTLNSWSLDLCVQTTTQLGTEEFQFKDLSLYPNPAKDILNVSISDGNLPEAFVIYNSLGQLIQEGNVNSESDLSINTSRFATGVYLIKLNKGNTSKTLKFIKE